MEQKYLCFAVSCQALRDLWTIYVFKNSGWQLKDQYVFQPGDELGFL